MRNHLLVHPGRVEVGPTESDDTFGVSPKLPYTDHTDLGGPGRVIDAHRGLVVVPVKTGFA